MATDKAPPPNSPATLPDYELERTPLRGRSTREDWHVRTPTPTAALERTNIVDQLRQFFDALDRELDEHAHDPVALSQALARMEAVLADVRYVRDRCRSMAATALDAQGVRKLTVEHVATVEGTSTVDRTDWQHERLARDLLRTEWDAGRINHPNDVAELLLECAGIAYWRLGAVRAHGLEPDDYCTVAQDDDGKPVRTPTVRMVDNRVRRMR